MKRIIITGAALLAIIPASLGLIGNASFAQTVPVRVPSQATLVGGQSRHIEIGDDKGGLSAHVEPGDDKGGLSTHVEPGDDKGGLSTHVEPGDDKGGLNATQIEGTDDKVSTSGSGKVDDGAKVDVKGGADDSAGHK
jgi:hypothetical protein